MQQNKVLYKDDTNVAIMGVCSGLADYLEVRVDYVRLAAVLLLLFTSGIVFVIYIVLGIALPTKSSVLGNAKGNTKSYTKQQPSRNFKQKNDKKSDFSFDQDDYSFDEDDFKI